MTIAPLAADDAFTVEQGLLSTTTSGNLGADNGSGVDADPDGAILGWTSPFVSGSSEDFWVFFNGGTLTYMTLGGTVSYPFPVTFTSLVITTAGGGQVILGTNGNFTYTSAAGFSGVDWFEYKLFDAEFNWDIARVTINVLDTEAGNDKPIAADDIFFGFEDTAISGNVLADNGNGADTDPNGDAITITAATFRTVHGGTVTLSANGDFLYQPTANYSGPDAFTYTIKDSHGVADTATVSITLAPVNDAPVAYADDFTGMHRRSIQGNVLANNGHGADSDLENDPLNVVAQTFTTAMGGYVVLLVSGDFTYSPTAYAVGQDSFTYTVEDGQGEGSSATVSLNMTNLAPIAADDSYTAAMGTTIAGNVLNGSGGGYDYDFDGDTIALVTGVITTATGNQVTLAADGSFSYVPAELYFGADSFVYTVNDGFGGTDTATVFLTIQAPAGSIYGSSYGDSLNGTAVADTIFGLAGDDFLYGLDGNDLLSGGDGRDSLTGGNGNDKLYGQAGKDVLVGGAGSDTLSGGTEVDDLNGGDGIDWITGGAGLDKLTGGLGNDMFVFDAANGTSSDRIADFKTGDKLCFNAAHYGLTAGALPNTTYYATAGAAAVGHGRFVYASVDRSLSWDADGNWATANTIVATFDKSVTLSAADFLIL